MLSISYDDVYSRFLGSVQAYDLVQLSEEDATEKMLDWIMSVRSNPRVRKMFTTLSFDSSLQSIMFELKNSQDDQSAIDYVTELFSLGMVYKWCEEKYNSVLNTSMFFGGSEQKFYSQANHMAELKEMTNSAKLNFYSAISNHGYYNNSYIGGE